MYGVLTKLPRNSGILSIILLFYGFFDLTDFCDMTENIWSVQFLYGEIYKVQSK